MMSANTARLTIILGYAAGVGKTYRMLEEGHKLQAEGRDVVVGYFEPHARPATIAKTEGLELIPPRMIEYRGLSLPEMDIDAILARRPEICLVDEFPHTNVPGSPRAKRWEDILVLLETGMDVLTTMNIQHLESLNDKVHEISGVAVRETIPDWLLKRADEIVFVDLTPSALLNRLDRGVVYSPEKAERAKQNFFQEPTLAALRELALRQTAHEVDVRTPDLTAPPRELASAPRPSAERILIHVTESPSSVSLIRRGRRVADYLRAECFALSVVPAAGIQALPVKEREALEQHLDFARKLHIETRIVESNRPASAIAQFARTNGVTQIFVAKPARPTPSAFFSKHFLVMAVLREANDIQLTVVAERPARKHP